MHPPSWASPRCGRRGGLPRLATGRVHHRPDHQRRRRVASDMTPTVVWMRHGTCADGHLNPAAHARLDSPLHPLGVDQVTAAATALRAAGWRPALVVTSPLPRAAASAATAAAVFGLAEIRR